MTNEPEKYYRTAEAAEILNVNSRTVARWINNGVIKATKLNPLGENSPFIISQKELDRFLELRKQAEGQ